MVEGGINKVVKWVILVLVLVIVLLGVVFLGVPEKIGNLFPDFGKEDVVVSWDEDVFLEHPEMIIIQYNDGKWSGDIIGFGIGDLYYNHDDNVGWRWSVDDDPNIESKDWLAVKNENHYLFNKLNREDTVFVRSLNGKSAEEGLIMLIERMLKEDTSLSIRVAGVWGEIYDKNDKIVKNLDMLIDKLNQISRGGIKNG
ncbi:hypothetical protein HOE04_05535 [archaeon]|jgi:hypothetical protein|nr:hypothetical protein [archaeon]